MRFDPDGAQHFPAAFSANRIVALKGVLDFTDNRPGTRLGSTGLAPLIKPATAIATLLLGRSACPVRATTFDKSATRNWALGWHQDRTIAVRDRIDTPGFHDWTVKGSIHHVVPPFEILEQMLTVRIHLDAVPPSNAPLLIVPGSHRLGRIPEAQIVTEVERFPSAPCPAERGDIWVYSTPILHASQRATAPSRRRVLQLLYSAESLPNGLEWLGV